MSNNKQYPEKFIAIIQCPRCGSGAHQEFNFEKLHCTRCGSDHFSLGNVPCLFPAGAHHKLIWQHQTAIMKSTAQQGLSALQESLSRYDLTNTTRQRLSDIFNSSKINLTSILSLLQNNGIEPVINDQLTHMHHGDISEYFDLLLRDWAWDSSISPNQENTLALQRIMNVIADLSTKPQRILVLGAGAGRLSWDLHTQLKPEFTVALDSNPLLLAAANELVYQQQPLTAGEFKNFPQIDFPVTKNWTINAVNDPEHLRDSWFLMGADAWQLPFTKNCFDLIITPWFIDVNGGDVRDLIGVITENLTENGLWINSGPLLFTRHLPAQLKYTSTEIKEFIALAGFTFNTEKISTSEYLLSPLEARSRQEQIWTFGATKEKVKLQDYTGTPAWLIMHHLPIPTADYTCQDSHPLIDTILEQVNGINSINDICYAVASQLPENVAVKDVVVTLFGQIIANNQASPV